MVRKSPFYTRSAKAENAKICRSKKATAECCCRKHIGFATFAELSAKMGVLRLQAHVQLAYRDSL